MKGKCASGSLETGPFRFNERKRLVYGILLKVGKDLLGKRTGIIKKVDAIDVTKYPVLASEAIPRRY